MSNELKSCPFCGHSGDKVKIGEAFYLATRMHGATAGCENCGTFLSEELATTEGGARMNAVNTWNTRPAPGHTAGIRAAVVVDVAVLRELVAKWRSLDTRAFTYGDCADQLEEALGQVAP